MSTRPPQPIAPPVEHCFVYVDCTIPPGVTLDDWRRAPRGSGRPRRRRATRRLSRVVR